MGRKSHFLVFVVLLTFIGSSYEETDAEQTKPMCVAPDGAQHACGENAICVPVPPKGHICHCHQGYTGDPHQGCVRKDVECIINAECKQSHYCLNDKCVDSCDGICGLNALCEIKNHQPICSCPKGYHGDPFISCIKENVTVSCEPNSCGLNTKCHVVENKIVCSCLDGFIGSPLVDCMKKCESKSECPESNPVCEHNVCVNPCKKACGAHASCQLVGESPVCTCPEGTTGNPLKRCSGIENPCDPAPCGEFTVCRVVHGKPVCSCLTGYQGNPLDGCNKSPCDADSDCGLNATCFVSHEAGLRKTCKCSEGSYGDPFVACHRDSCSDASQCPSSRPKCVKNSCIDDCDNQCGENAVCQTENDSAVCSCPKGFSGNPFIRCLSYALV